MAWHHTGLSCVGTYLLDYTVGIAAGNVKELGTARCLIMGAGSIHHMSEVVEFVTRMFLCCPTSVCRPSVGMLRVDGTGGIEIAVGFLGCSHHVEHGVDVGFKFRIGISLQNIRGSFDGFIDIGIVEREPHKLRHIPLRGLKAGMSRMLKCVGSHLEILVAVLALAFRECQRDGHLAGCLDTVAPERVGGDLHRGKRYLGIGIPALGHSSAQCEE